MSQFGHFQNFPSAPDIHDDSLTRQYTELRPLQTTQFFNNKDSRGWKI